MYKPGLNQIVVLTICIILTSCLAGVPSKQNEQLHTEVKTYGKLIRWRAYDEAAGYIRSPEDKSVIVDTEAYKEIRVTKYQLLTIELNEEQQEANVTAEISYYHERVNNVHTIVDNQLWWRDPDSGRWFINGSLPALTP